MTICRGVVIQFDAQAGYGFVRSPAYNEDVFVHISAISNGQPLRPGQRVLFSAEPSERGLRALRVTSGRAGLTPAMLGGLVTIASLIVITLGLKRIGAPMFWAWIGAVNPVALALYSLDKHRAVRGGRRVPEAVLLGLALIGGSPAAALGMILLRHKTRKTSFLVAFTAIVVVQTVVAVGWLVRR